MYILLKLDTTALFTGMALVAFSLLKKMQSEHVSRFRTPQERDAIHIAVAPIIATQRLEPGYHVGIEGNLQNPIGIVDPFLNTVVEIGEKFWLYLFPGSITSLRHDWTHPAFEKALKGSGTRDPECRSKKWLEEFGIRNRDTYEELILRLDIYADGEYSDDSGSYDAINSMSQEEKRSMWAHYENATGKNVSESVILKMCTN